MPKSLARSPHIRRASAPSCGGRIVALLLVTCLIADPVTSAAVSNTLVPGGRGRSPAEHRKNSSVSSRGSACGFLEPFRRLGGRFRQIILGQARVSVVAGDQV